MIPSAGGPDLGHARRSSPTRARRRAGCSTPTSSVELAARGTRCCAAGRRGSPRRAARSRAKRTPSSVASRKSVCASRQSSNVTRSSRAPPNEARSTRQPLISDIGQPRLVEAHAGQAAALDRHAVRGRAARLEVREVAGAQRAVAQLELRQPGVDRSAWCGGASVHAGGALPLRSVARRDPRGCRSRSRAQHRGAMGGSSGVSGARIESASTRPPRHVPAAAREASGRSLRRSTHGRTRERSAARRSVPAGRDAGLAAPGRGRPATIATRAQQAAASAIARRLPATRPAR